MILDNLKLSSHEPIKAVANFYLVQSRTVEKIIWVTQIRLRFVGVFSGFGFGEHKDGRVDF